MPTLPPPPPDDVSLRRWFNLLYAAVKSLGAIDLTAINAAIAALQSDVTALETDMTAAESDIDDLEANVVYETGAQSVDGKTITNSTIGAVSAWTTPSFSNSWVDYGAPWPTVGYRKLASGHVEFRGAIKNGSYLFAQELFVLPVGYRPVGKCLFWSISAGGQILLEVEADGSVLVYPLPDAIDANEVVLCPISFPTN